MTKHVKGGFLLKSTDSLHMTRYFVVIGVNRKNTVQISDLEWPFPQIHYDVCI